MSPFGGYADFDDCVQKNKNKDNPEGWCSELHFTLTGEWPLQAATKEAAMSFVNEMLDAMPDDADISLKQVERVVDVFSKWAGVDPGNYPKCASVLKSRGGITNPEALCAWLHHNALGKWPAQKSTPLEGPIMFKNTAKRIVIGPVLVPGEKDHEGDVLTAEEIEEKAYEFMERFRLVDISHSLKEAGVPVSSDLLRFEEKHYINGKEVTLPVGTWMLGTRLSKQAWKGVEDGTFKGYSVMGVPREAFNKAVASMKGDGVPAGMTWEDGVLRKITLEDLGHDWVPVAVSVLKYPSVHKALFVAVKGEKSIGERISRLFRRLANKGENVGEDIEDNKEDNEMEKEEIKALVQKEVGDIIDSAIKKAIDDFNKASDAAAKDKAASSAQDTQTKAADKAGEETTEQSPPESDADVATEAKTDEQLAAIKGSIESLSEQVKKLSAVKSQGLKEDHVAAKKESVQQVVRRDPWGRRLKEQG